MRIVKISTESLEQTDLTKFAQEDWAGKAEERRRVAKGIQDGLGTPVDLGYLAKVGYEVKGDRYLATFTGSEKSLVLKTTDEVAEFLATNLRKAGTWVGRMEKGVLVEVNLITLE